MADMKFECPKCSQPLEAPEEMAGEVIECPSCGEQITIPENNKENQSTDSPFPNLPNLSIDEPYVEQANNASPECGAQLPDGGVLCLECGFHTKLGKKINTEFEE